MQSEQGEHERGGSRASASATGFLRSPVETEGLLQGGGEERGG